MFIIKRRNRCITLNQSHLTQPAVIHIHVSTTPAASNDDRTKSTDIPVNFVYIATPEELRVARGVARGLEQIIQ